MKRLSLNSLLATLIVAVLPIVAGATGFSDLKDGQKINGWTATTVYLNAAEKPMGARFVSDKYGFVLDLMTIQSVPQGFFWIKTPPESDKGEPHTCEHLLLGKGNVGRYVASLEDMSLGTSTAYTAQTHTCYHFNTKGDEDIFYKLFEAKLNAFCNPDFTDEEIRREVCHVGVTVDPKDGTLALEEKGTVYTEMVSSFEKHWYHLWSPLDEMLYGPDHPMANNSGGNPDDIRTMVPADLWKFQKESYRLGNMGVIVSLPNVTELESALGQFGDILGRVQERPETPTMVGISKMQMPSPQPPKPKGTIVVGGFPSENPEDPGHMLFGWPVDRTLDNRQAFMLDLFLQTFADGSTSDLYNLFINSQTRKIDLGGNEVFGYTTTDPGFPVYVGLSGINNANVTETMVDSVRAMVVGAIRRVAELGDASAELKEFNERASAHLTSTRKQYEQNLNSPPMFGFRSGPAGQWMALLGELEQETGFTKSLVMKDHFAAAEKLLSTDKNFWTDYIATWKLLSEPPYAVAVKPDAEMLRRETARKEQRFADYTKQYEEEFGLSDPQAALAAYKEEFDAKTTELDALAAKDVMPGFMDNPPLTLDPNLAYDVVTLPGNISMVASTFENMTSATLGLALRLDVIPENQLVYVPLLSDVMTEIGAVKDGKVVPYDAMSSRLQNEIYSLRAYLDYSTETERVELIIRGTGSNRDELMTAIDWMDAVLYTPYLEADNLPRLRDVIDQNLTGLRNRVKRSEEAWVQEPANAWLYQSNPLLLTANNFLTQVHAMHRLKFRLADPGFEPDQTVVSEFLAAMESFAAGMTREAITLALAEVDNYDGTATAESGPVVKALAATEGLSTANENAKQIIRALRACLAEIPDASLAQDWSYLCREIRSDLMFDPNLALAELNNALRLIRKADNVRLFMISNSDDRTAALAKIEALTGKLDRNAPSMRQSYTREPHILERLNEHAETNGAPVYVGLRHDNTRNGVLIFTAQNAGNYDTSQAAVLDALAGKLYSGGGGHGLFMRTWSAGLAYSNGISYNDSRGRVNYYAERCPDVSETMRFVVKELKSAKEDPALTDYSIAQVFGASRAADRYETRGEQMAADLTDGRTPERVAAFRAKVLQTRHSELLSKKLFDRMEQVYGRVLIGYGEKLEATPGSSHFLIGPQSQFESLEQLIEIEEGAAPVYQLYPRDYWLPL
jgi:Zn-dependent M16 (insulinase) family peptidase